MSAPAAPEVPGPLVAETGVWEVFHPWLRRATILTVADDAALAAPARAGMAGVLLRQLRQHHPAVQVQVLDGGQVGDVVPLGVE